MPARARARSPRRLPPCRAPEQPQEERPAEERGHRAHRRLGAEREEREPREGIGDALVLEETILVDTDADVQNGPGFALALRNDGRFAVAYTRSFSDEPPIECVLFGGETVSAPVNDVLVVDEQADGSFRTRIVDSVPQQRGRAIDMIVDPTSDALVIAYAGGGPAAGACEASDLVVSVGGEEPGGTIAEVLAYRIAERRWVQLDDLRTPRHGLGVAALAGRVYVIGGGPEPGLTVSSANESLAVG